MTLIVHLAKYTLYYVTVCLYVFLRFANEFASSYLKRIITNGGVFVPVLQNNWL